MGLDVRLYQCLSQHSICHCGPKEVEKHVLSWEGRGFVMRKIPSRQEENYLPLPAQVEDGTRMRERGRENTQTLASPL